MNYRKRTPRMIKKIIKIDYDKTIDNAKYPDVGSPVPLAIETIKELSMNYILILDTCRHDSTLRDAVLFLSSVGIEFDYVNENAVGKIERFGDTRKIYADYSIDDKDIFTPLIDGCVDWSEVRKVFRLGVIS